MHSLAKRIRILCHLYIIAIVIIYRYSTLLSYIRYCIVITVNAFVVVRVLVVVCYYRTFVILFEKKKRKKNDITI